MKYIRLLIVVLIVIIGVCLIGAGVLMLSGKNPSDFRSTVIPTFGKGTFQDPSLGISFRYPKEWEQRYAPPSTVVFFGTGGVPTMTLAVQKRKEGETLEQLSKNNSEEIVTSGRENNFIVITQKIDDWMVDARAGKRMEYRFQHDGKVIRGVQIWTVEKKMEYIITFAAPSEQFEAAVQTFENVLQSVHISEVKN